MGYLEGCMGSPSWLRLSVWVLNQFLGLCVDPTYEARLRANCVTSPKYGSWSAGDGQGFDFGISHRFCIR